MNNQQSKVKNPKRYLLTTALPYANGPIHIGHLAGVYIPADIYARYLRSKGEDVLLIGGSDEHGVPITIKARQQGISPQELVNKYHTIIKQSFIDLGISFDIYSRTSSAIHHQTASDFFRTLYDKGCFIEKTTEQYYDEENKQFLADRYITGTCPHCNSEGAYGDQCEKCGSSLNATDLINPKSAISGNVPVMKATKHWYLPLEQYEDFLRQWILVDHKEDWKTNVYGQCKSWIDGGLQARAVTRDLDWGVKVPIEGADDKVLYVWFDAPLGYISATKECTPDWEKYWKSPDTKMVHFIGKDNIVFHCIIFPAMLKAEGSYILPENVPANEFLNLENDKISTSRNWAVWLHEYLLDFPGKQDVLRYVLTANAPETKDNDFTWKDFQARNNNELLAVFGNFVNRTLVLTQKYFEGIVPKVEPANYTDLDQETRREMGLFPNKIADSIERYRFREALGECMNLARLGNKYLTETEPWKIYKTDPLRVQTILNLSLQICAHLAIVCEPFLPFTAEKLRNMLQIEKMPWSRASELDLLEVSHQIGTPDFLFEKIEDAQVENQIAKLQASKEFNKANAKVELDPAKESVSLEEFTQMDIRVATILEAEKVAKTKKLMKLKVDTGIDIRTVVSGIAEHYQAKDLIGRKVCMLINLAPKELKGIESQGMVLMTQDATGKLIFVEPALTTAYNGAVIR
ncbi:MAG: methionine--tRNA ligase [Bacteroidales bacterium]